MHQSETHRGQYFGYLYPQVATEMENVLTMQREGRMAGGWQLFAIYMGSKAWSSCAQMISKSLNPVYEQIDYVSRSCMVPYPELQSGQNTEAYCQCREAAGVTNDPWCTNPCCNHELEKFQCCAASTTSMKAFRPTLNEDGFRNICTVDDENLAMVAIEEASFYAKISR
jgi:hypothetical protein